MSKYLITVKLSPLLVEKEVEAEGFEEAIKLGETLKASDFIKFNTRGWIDGGDLELEGVYKI